MALFKILKGKFENLPSIYHEGYMYITEDTGKIYVDIASGPNEGDPEDKVYRIVLNANAADKLISVAYDDNGNPLESSFSISDATQLELRLDELYGLVTDNGVDILNLSKDVDAINENIGSAGDGSDEEKNTIYALIERETARATAKETEIEESFASFVTSLDTDLDNITDSIADNAMDITNMRKDVDNISAHIGEARDSEETYTIHEKIETVADALKDARSSLTDAITSLETNIGTQIDSINDTRAEDAIRITTLEHKVGEEGDETNAATGLYAKLNEEATARQSADADLAEDLALLNQDILSHYSDFESHLTNSNETLSEHQTTLTAHQDAITIIQGADTNVSMRQVAEDVVNSLVIEADEDGIVNKLEEIVSWLNDENGGANAIATDLANLKSRMENAEEDIAGNTTNHLALAVTLDGDVAGSGTIASGNKITINTTLKNLNISEETTYGPAESSGVGYGATISVPQITMHKDGRVKTISNKTITLPASDNTDTKVTSVDNHYTPAANSASALSATASGSTATATHGTTELVTGVNITRDAKGHVTGLTVNSIKAPTAYSHPTHTAKTSGLYKITVDALGHVSAATAVAKADITGLGIPAQDTVYTHPSYTARTGVPTADATLTHGGKFTVTQPVCDAMGHITGMNTRTYTLPADNNTDTKVTTAAQSSATIYVTGCTGATTGTLQYNSNVYINSNVLFGAAWNDYAEFREADTLEPGRVICENGDDTLGLATKRLQPGASIVSDTFGFAIGETEKAKTPIAVSGRVLAYPYEDRNTYNPGDAVCAAPGGTVSKMTREEIMKYPERIIGTVSAIPEYKTWGENDVLVNGRIWIKVK